MEKIDGIMIKNRIPHTSFIDIKKAMKEYALILIDEILDENKRFMAKEQRYHSSGEMWCRVCITDIKDLKQQIENE